MEKITYKEALAQKIAEKIPEAPHNWAEIAAERMGKHVSSVYAYARCEKGVRRGRSAELLKLLNQMIDNQKKELKIISE
jgi:hypothetical protein